MNNKIIVPKEVANAIAHYVALADTKTEALQDILRLGYEAERSEIILRHFEHDYDELMEALICGYQIEKTPEEQVAEYWNDVNHRWADSDDACRDRYFEGSVDAIITVLGIYGIKISGVNAQ
jgi:DNA integrity scanning protein DisA with diadenylate cyclase activity